MAKTKRAAGNPAARRSGGLTAACRKHFLAVLAETANIAQAARQAGVERSSLYRLRGQSESFRAAWDEAMNQALDDLEAVLLERAAHGVEKPVFYGGKACGAVRHYSDTLAMFILRAKRPEVYGKMALAPDQPEIEDDDPAKAREKVHERLHRMAERLQTEEQA